MILPVRRRMGRPLFPTGRQKPSSAKRVIGQGPMLRGGSAIRNPQSEIRNPKSAFTLIELIATLVLSGILVAMLLPLIGSGLTESSRPLLRAPETYTLRSAMEECWNLYRSGLGEDLPDLSDAIVTLAADTGFTLHYNDWVRFDDDTGALIETPGVTTNILCITIGNAQGDRLTAFFSPLQP